MSEIMVEAFKTCPFCGGNGACVIARDIYSGDRMFSIGCADCGCMSDLYKKHEHAIEAWNTRVSEVSGE
jgi:Lar family restriction alleviation protein